MVCSYCFCSTWITIFPNNLHLTLLFLCLFVTLLRKNAFHWFCRSLKQLIFYNIIFAPHALVTIPKQPPSEIILNDEWAIFTEMTLRMPYTVRGHHCPLPTTQLPTIHFFHYLFLFITHAIYNISYFRINKLDGLIIGMFSIAAYAKALAYCLRKLCISMSCDKKCHCKGKSNNCALWAFNQSWTMKVDSMQLTSIVSKDKIHWPTKTCWFNFYRHKETCW